MADKAAKEAAEKADTRRYLEQFTSLTQIGHTVMERNSKEAKN